MSKQLYHFTSSAQLPRIIRSGALIPAEFKEPRDFVHATANENGERTAAGFWYWNGVYRAGHLQRVRFTLAAEDFEPWLDVCARYPKWTADMIERLQKVAREQRAQPADWYCRADPLPLSKVLAVHTRAYTGHRWEPFDLATATVVDLEGPKSFDVDGLGVKIGEKIYPSVRTRRYDGHDAYNVCKPIDTKRRAA
jgi:hypothetical protein